MWCNPVPMAIQGWVRRAVVAAGVAVAAGCGGSGAEPSTSSDADASASGDSSGATTSAAASPIVEKLQGEWEIIRYVSSEAIPPEAMPLLAEMFETLVLKFEGGTVEAGGETVDYQIEPGEGESFLLHAKGGMFDGATCRFVGEDEVEVVDEGEQWPGTSLLRRMNP